MGRPDLSIDDATGKLTITIDKGNKQWVARVTGTDDQYDLDREFISPYGRGTEVVDVEDGDVVEMCWHSHGGREKGRNYYVVAGDDLCKIEREHVERALDATVVAIDAESGRTHECDECGDEFDSEHGLAVHAGLVHADDEDEADDEDVTEPAVTAEETAQPVATDGGEGYDAPTAEEFSMEQKRTLECFEEDDGNPVAGIEYRSLEDGLHPGLPYYFVSVEDVATLELNIGIDRPAFDENWVGRSWDGFLAGYPYDEIGMDVGELLVWRRPHDDDARSFVEARHTLDGERVVETDETVEEMAYRLLDELLDESDFDFDVDDDPEIVTDGGVVADGGDGTDWDLVAGDEPSRNGTRRIIDTDEARTPYTDSSTFHGELLGIDMEIGTRFSGDTISYVNIQPQIPKRPSQASGVGWLSRIGVEEGAYEDLYTDGDADEPLPGYQAETTGDYRDAEPEDPRGDGVYARDSANSPLTAQIADVVTREGGRIPTDFSAAVQNEGYARSRDWTVYAPAHNPHHVAAAVTDVLRETDGVSDVRVSVSERAASDVAQRLRSTGIGYVFDRDSEADFIERALRVLRWESGLPVGRRRALHEAPTEVHERLEAADFEDKLTDYKTQIQTLVRRPGDAWDYHEVSIHINEEAEEAYYG